MTPMMSRPLPRPVGKKKFKSEEKAKKAKPTARLAVVAIVILLGGAAAGLLWGAGSTSVRKGPPKYRIPNSTQFAATVKASLEHGDEWAGKGNVRLPRAKKLLADAKGAKLGRTKHKTNLMEINLRTLVTEKTPLATDEKSRARLDDEIESDSALGARPAAPKRIPSDRHGKVIAGKGNDAPVVKGPAIE